LNCDIYFCGDLPHPQVPFVLFVEVNNDINLRLTNVVLLDRQTSME